MSKWLFRYTAVLAFCVLGLIVLGAAVTSEIQPIPGPVTPQVSASAQTEVLLERAHVLAAWAVGVLTLGLAVWLQLVARRAWMRWLGWTAFAVVVVEGWLGMRGIHDSTSGAAGFFHAMLAQVLLSIVVVSAVGGSEEPERDQLVEHSGRPLFRSLAVTMLSLTLLQTLLGAAYRHNLMGVLWHILNALVVAVVVLVACILLIRQYPGHSSVRPAALVLAIVTGVQVALGFAVFILLLISSGGTTALLILSVCHVATGALTLAASAVLTIEILRNVRFATPRMSGKIEAG